MKPQRLLLFDIDGTLLSNTREAFVRPFSEAIRETLGVKVDTENYRSGGKTDPEMIHELLAPFAYSHEEIENAIPVIRDRYIEKVWPYFRGQENVVLKPGVETLLQTLSRCQEVVLGLITGNFEVSARMKLEAHKPNRYFPLGAFGDEAPNRFPLPGRAVEEAYRYTGFRFQKKNIVIIGDTPHDVRCGRHLDVLTVAVATGLYSIDALQKENPDYLWENLADTDLVLKALLPG
jgi:phosphoglycolate phosphatase-like HAD superfamily hydrolase